MPRLVNSTPAYCLHKKSGRAYISLSGQRVYLGKHGTPESRRAYNRVVGEWLTNGRMAPAPALGAAMVLTVADLVARYWTFCERYYIKNGRATDEQASIRCAMRPLVEVYGDTPAADFGPLQLKAVRDRMVAGGLSRTWINQNVGRIRRAFKWAIAEGLIPAAVMLGLSAVSGLKRGRSEARETDPVTPVPQAHVDAVLPLLSRQLQAVVQLQLLTGARSGEVLSMRASDLNMSGTVWEFRPEHHKTEHHGKARVLFLGPKAQAVVKPFLKADLGAWLFDAGEAEVERCAKRREDRATPLWPSHLRRYAKQAAKAAEDHFASRPYTREAYGRAISRACKLAGVPHWHPHQLRHNAATMLRRELGIEAARAVLGHSSAAITEIYAEVDLAKAKDAMSRLG